MSSLFCSGLYKVIPWKQRANICRQISQVTRYFAATGAFLYTARENLECSGTFSGTYCIWMNFKLGLDENSVTIYLDCYTFGWREKNRVEFPFLFHYCLTPNQSQRPMHLCHWAFPPLQLQNTANGLRCKRLHIKEWRRTLYRKRGFHSSPGDTCFVTF